MIAHANRLNRCPPQNHLFPLAMCLRDNGLSRTQTSGGTLMTLPIPTMVNDSVRGLEFDSIDRIQCYSAVPYIPNRAAFPVCTRVAFSTSRCVSQRVAPAWCLPYVHVQLHTHAHSHTHSHFLFSCISLSLFDALILLLPQFRTFSSSRWQIFWALSSDFLFLNTFYSPINACVFYCGDRSAQLRQVQFLSTQRLCVYT